MRTLKFLQLLGLTFVIPGCQDVSKSEEGPVADQDTASNWVTDESADEPVNVQYAISEEQAMQIAMTGLDSSIFTATSTIIGPMLVGDQEIEAYEVTVNGGNQLVLRYVNADSGELLTDHDAWHDLPSTETEADTGAAPPPPSYYTACPGGWPLCIKTPSSITFYSQNDPTWKSKKINGGGAASTIGAVGCLLSSYAMALTYSGHTYTTYTLDLLGDSKNCYYTSPSGSASESGEFLSSSIAGYAGGHYTTIGVGDVWSTLAGTNPAFGYKALPVVVYGYSTCLGSNHAQMLWGHDGSRYWAKDPWYDWANQDQSMCINSPSYRVLY